MRKTRVFILLSLIVLPLSLFSQANMQEIDPPKILIDQFGYMPEATKIAYVKNPFEGYDAGLRYTNKPGTDYVVVNEKTQIIVYEGTLVRWVSEGNANTATLIDKESGDQMWMFDFSSVTVPGEYYILDKSKDTRSYTFRIAEDVYHDVFKQAIRSYYFQRCGINKVMPYVEDEKWIDMNPSYMGPGQDTECQRYDLVDIPVTDENREELKKTLRDVSGGWYDAGDLNKYVTFMMNPMLQLLQAYEESPSVWTDDYNIPESGNGIPDILDELKWEVDWMLRMQEDNGSLLSVVGGTGPTGAGGYSSPVSKDKSPRKYGPATTAATLTGAAIFSYASKVFATLDTEDMRKYSATLREAAIKAWDWAVENPKVVFYNTGLIAAGEQELSDDDRWKFKLVAAVHLYDLTQEDKYHQVFLEAARGNNRGKIFDMGLWLFGSAMQHTLLYYPYINNPDPAMKKELLDWFKKQMETGQFALDNSYRTSKRAFPSYLDTHIWGSNQYKGMVGGFYYEMLSQGFCKEEDEKDYYDAAACYLHYLHGVNPMNFVFFSNMFKYGGDNGVTEFFHSWFGNGTEYQNCLTSPKGCPPGFLVGGCNSSQEFTTLTPPIGQPVLKSYRDFSDWGGSYAWTENSVGYTSYYIRLVSKFLSPRLVHGKAYTHTYSQEFRENTLLNNWINRAEESLKKGESKFDKAKKTFSKKIDTAKKLDVNDVTVTKQEYDYQAESMKLAIKTFESSPDSVSTGVNEPDLDSYSVSPTVVNNCYVVKLPAKGIKDISVEVYDSTGSLLLKRKQQTKIEAYGAETLAYGLNFIKIVNTKNGQVVFSAKLVRTQ